MCVARGLCADYPQWNVSFNDRRDTLRGLHFQVRPHEEIKLVSCTRGAIFDVAVDVRAGSPSYGKWVGLELSADSRSSVYIPAGFAHGYQTLTDDAEVRYCVSERYHPEAERGVRWDDPDLAIAWPKASQRVISGARSGPAKIAGLITRSPVAARSTSVGSQNCAGAIRTPSDQRPSRMQGEIVGWKPPRQRQPIVRTPGPRCRRGWHRARIVKARPSPG